MNDNPIKQLIQVKDPESESPKVSFTFLFTEEALEGLLNSMRNSEVKHAAVSFEVKEFNTDIMLEVYKPGMAQSTVYQTNLQREGWETLFVSTL